MVVASQPIENDEWNHQFTDPLLVDLWNRTHRDNMHCVILVVGRMGSGKSSLSLSLAEALEPHFWRYKWKYKVLRNKNSNPELDRMRFLPAELPEYKEEDYEYKYVDHPEPGEKYERVKLALTEDDCEHIIRTRIANEPYEFINIVSNNDEMKIGSVVIVDEAGAQMNYEDWQKTNNKLLSVLMQTVRTERFVIIFTVPSIKFLAIQQRRLLDFIITAKGYDMKRRVMKCKIKEVSHNPEIGGEYFKYPRYTIRGQGTYKYNFYEFKMSHQPLWSVFKRMNDITKRARIRAMLKTVERFNAPEDQKPDKLKIKSTDYNTMANIIFHKIKNKEMRKRPTIKDMKEIFSIPESKAKIVVSLIKERLVEDMNKKS